MWRHMSTCFYAMLYLRYAISTLRHLYLLGSGYCSRSIVFRLRVTALGWAEKSRQSRASKVLSGVFILYHHGVFKCANACSNSTPKYSRLFKYVWLLYLCRDDMVLYFGMLFPMSAVRELSEFLFPYVRGGCDFHAAVYVYGHIYAYAICTAL